MEEKGGSSLQGSHIEFRRMYETALPVVYGFVYTRVGGDKALAEDVTSEVFAAAVQECRAGRFEVITISWLRTIAKRRLVDHWRHQQIVRNKKSLTFERQNLDGEPNTGERQLILQTLAGLSQHERTALVLQHLEGYTVREISEIVGRSEKATESLLSRARSSFRTSYSEAQHG